MTPLDRLLAENACRQLAVDTAHAVDTQDYIGFAGLFTETGALVRPDGTRLEGRDAIAQAYANRDPDRLTRHVLSNQRVQLLNPDEAHCQTTVLLWTGRHSDVASPNGRPADPAQLLGEFIDHMVLTAEGWRIRQRLARFVLHR